ncbi:hypothetical protein ASPZODRAFT_126823 [Penicilliopsis zonata CBS 506.65]|uniref:Capsule synthesis protein CapA domain-containing protein n=1 Tax=Penicilliopsis zonata CBS 506.65 TaxID=1073090 RepID=A0A1L9SUG7_9EURO|nr:hypothetical protein ASPZODRAFT_126823 [Penicilliopsis zonata CBS 506.65]OJJ50865.1 hypothetical protein ASPZODRAFT_126823 [Penicilliopsis zonata CBS 506.65]
MSNSPRTYTLNFLGDVMLGRLVDQLFPQHVSNAREAEIITSFTERAPSFFKNYTHRSPWGNTLPLLHQADMNLINLETSVTTSRVPWPDKAFNYRMHPANIAVLHEGQVDYASLANNHTLDFGTEGLVETVWTLKTAHIAFAGAGETNVQASRAVELKLPRVYPPSGRRSLADKYQKMEEDTKPQTRDKDHTHIIHVYSAADHPHDWAVVPTFNLIDYSSTTRHRLKHILMNNQTASGGTSALNAQTPALKIFSVHWGPNYAWHPDERTIRSLAHFLVDECGVDIIHGHSSHHIQGVEVYRGKLIIYGCGDFVDDYALNEVFRNDLGAVWRVTVSEKQTTDTTTSSSGVELSTLEIFPTRIERFQAHLLEPMDPDYDWTRRKVTVLSERLGTTVNSEVGEQGQIVIDLKTQ